MPIRINGELLTDYVRRTAAPTARPEEPKHEPEPLYCRCSRCYEAHLEASAGALQ